MLENNFIVAVDFDGTITNEPNISPNMTLKAGAKDALIEFKKQGIRLILWTCRSGDALFDALDFLQVNGMDHIFDVVNEQLPEIEEKYNYNTSPKVGADVYIDDRNVLSGEINWSVIQPTVLNLAAGVISK